MSGAIYVTGQSQWINLFLGKTSTFFAGFSYHLADVSTIKTRQCVVNINKVCIS